jgi:hypothetical protein
LPEVENLEDISPALLEPAMRPPYNHAVTTQE